MKNKLSERSQASVWHPFTQMQLGPKPIGLVKGEGVYLYDEDGKKYIDAISSWWTCLHGHSHPYIADKIAEQARSLEHVIFAGFTHEPAVHLAERLLDNLPDNQARIFYSDNGSTAVEVGLKMAFQYWQNVQQEKTKVISFKEGYHGDTFGAMSVGSRSAFTAPFFPFLFDVEFIESPVVDPVQCVAQLKALVALNDVAAIVYEPLVQGAGGMLMYSPELLEEILGICKAHEVLCIADEVMTGFYRTGLFFASEACTISPDIMCLSKGLTGGVMAMGVTTCTAEIYEAFLSDHFMNKTFFHGHSFTANPIACAAANASMDLLLQDECQARIKAIQVKHETFMSILEGNTKVENVRAMGTILALDVKSETITGYGNAVRDEINYFFLEKGVLLRPLGNTLYLLPPYCITDEELDFIYSKIKEYLG
ncbi:MAG: adenosylmethionine-8-amino-7-oxononanoate aminotransferase [Chitinophagales bacterium]|jgi:adenosylmethionine-8-amino-7-oxononanoate aminotransferase